jgi:hypothetical protein
LGTIKQVDLEIDAIEYQACIHPRVVSRTHEKTIVIKIANKSS